MPTLANIVRAFGVEPDSIRQIARRQNVHWAVRAGDARYVLRRYGAETPGDAAWEIDSIERLAKAGVPVPRVVGGLREIEGARYILMPWLGRRRLAHPPVSDTAYERLGSFLADFHSATSHLPEPPQRPKWTSNVDGAFPRTGGATRRAELLAALAEVDATMARRLADAAATLEARDLPRVFAGYPRRLVHGDFAPWNIRVHGQGITGVIDFDLAHVDVRAADIAMARRGSHDGVVRGYLKRATLTDVEIDSLDALWTGGSLCGVWSVLESRLAAGRVTTQGLEWNVEQLGKTRPYRG
ncbi:MAG TPA: phosphotransferase [Caulobacteraceae bacterium]